MKNLFEQARSYWVRYDEYELKEGQNGVLYVIPTKSASPRFTILWQILKD